MNLTIENAMTFVEKVAEKLGGANSIKEMTSLQMFGYGQYAYMWGGGNISASPDAPQKYMAANELQRNWNFKEDTFQMKERRNMLFPFAAEFGHAFYPLNQVLDGEIAYDILPDGTMKRVAEFLQDPLTVDGRRIRRLWSLTNPVVVLHELLNHKLTVEHIQEKTDLVELALATAAGDKLKFLVDKRSLLPEQIKWNTAQTNLGEVTFTTTFTGYMPFDDLHFPMGYSTKINFRDIVYFKVYVDGYRVNRDVKSVQAPEHIASADIPQEFLPPLSVERVDDGVWRIAGIGGTTVIEFDDHLTLFELYWNQTQAKAIIDLANTLVPGKKATDLIISHHHFDHTGGFRAAVAQGLRIYANRENEGILREMAQRETPDFEDIITPTTDRNFEFVPIDEHIRLEDSKTILDIYRVISNSHMADAVFAYLPQQQIFMDSDIATAGFDWQFWPDSYLDNLERYELQVSKVTTVHEKVLTHSEVLAYIEAGKQRIQERHVKYLGMNEYLPGFPVFRTRKDN
ncbi:MBL fold metallo-hydrolase [Corynebacterium sp. 3HC-13]|nr:MBL fold metallo-hydrolase [Corynebacterium poyangense]MBZ8178104.1 MBL fold metallo-hydrolase [Corynebacterium poyangense]